MKDLNSIEIQSVSGGFIGPHTFDGLFEAIFVLAGATAAATFVIGLGLGLGGSYLYSYTTTSSR